MDKDKERIRSLEEEVWRGKNRLRFYDTGLPPKEKEPPKTPFPADLEKRKKELIDERNHLYREIYDREHVKLRDLRDNTLRDDKRLEINDSFCRKIGSKPDVREIGIMAFPLGGSTNLKLIEADIEKYGQLEKYTKEDLAQYGIKKKGLECIKDTLYNLGLSLKPSPIKETKSQIKEKRLKAVQEALDSRAKSIEDAINKAGYEQTDILLSRKQKKLFKIKILNQALEEEIKSIEELCNRTNTNPVGLYTFSQKNDISISFDNMAPYLTEPKIDRLIPKGLTLRQMVKKAGYSTEHIRKYIIGSGQCKTWGKAKLGK